MTKRHHAARVDPIAEAKRQWIQHGWQDAADGMSAVTSVMRAHQLMLSSVEAVLKPHGLSFARFELLRLLAFTRNGQMPMSSVVSRLQVHPASVTSVVDRLVRDGYVIREPHPDDGRATLLTLTKAGHDITEEATQALNENAFTETGLSADDTRAIVGILARFRKQAGDFSDPRPLPEPLEGF